MMIYDRDLATAALASPPAAPIEVNTQFAALHTLLLGKLEKVDGQQFKGINVAVSNLAKRFASQCKGTVRLLVTTTRDRLEKKKAYQYIYTDKRRIKWTCANAIPDICRKELARTKNLAMK